MNAQVRQQTFYDILEIAQDAPQHEIHRAYQRAKTTYSPDSPALYSMFTPEEATELLGLIEEAYRTLGHIASREDYDKKIKSQTKKLVDEMPDFAPEVSGTPNPALAQRNVKPTPITKISDTPAAVPPGFAKSKFGVYELNEEMETTIKKSEKFNGELLRKIRNYKRINLEQLSAETRIGKSYLLALESDDPGGLPAHVFTRGFVVQLARALGLEPNKVANAYMENLNHKSK